MIREFSFADPYKALSSPWQGVLNLMIDRCVFLDDRF